jgi:hypothetical protein
MVVRPKGQGESYPRVLEARLNELSESLWIVDNLSRIAAMIDDTGAYMHRLVADRPDFVVLHFGHVEAIPRPLSRATWYRLHEVKPGSSAWRDRANLAQVRYAGVRRSLGLRRQWTSIERFRRGVAQVLTYLSDETRAQFLVVEANPGDARIEAWGPGSLAAIRAYNDVMRETSATFGAVWVPLSSFVRDPVGEYIADGTHLTPRGHAMLGNVLADLMLHGSSPDNGRNLDRPSRTRSAGERDSSEAL